MRMARRFPGGMVRLDVTGATPIVMARRDRAIGTGTRGAFGEGGSDGPARRLVSPGRAAPDGPVEPGHDGCGTIDALAAPVRDGYGTIDVLATPS